MDRKDALNRLHELVARSRGEESLRLLQDFWKAGRDAWEILDALHPLSLFAFSHRYPTIHIPKEHEYLYRLLKRVPEDTHVAFLGRFIEYLAWAPKYINDQGASIPSGVEEVADPKERYLASLEDLRGVAAPFYAVKMAEQEGLEAALRTMLQVGCRDVSQVIGHYFSCTESVIRLALAAGMPKAKNHLYLATLYLLQSSPNAITRYRKPTLSLEEILARLVRKGGFVGYHYMILANGLIRNREFLGENHYLHALHGLEMILPQLNDTLSKEKLSTIADKTTKSLFTLHDLKTYIMGGRKDEAFATLKRYLRKVGVTPQLEAAIAHSYTLIDDHPPDPHYVTFPTSAFQLIPYLRDDDVELILAHAVEFAVNRVQRYGIMPTSPENK